MNKQLFLNEINRLSSVYGDKYYPDDRVKIIWDWAKNQDIEILKIAISDLISDSHQAPLLGKIKEFYYETKGRLRRDGYMEKWLLTQPDCKKCGKNGFLVATKKETKEIYAFRCGFCNVGSKTNPLYAEWNESFGSQFDVEFNSVTLSEIKASVLKSQELRKSLECFGKE